MLVDGGAGWDANATSGGVTVIVDTMPLTNVDVIMRSSGFFELKAAGLDVGVTRRRLVGGLHGCEGVIIVSDGVATSGGRVNVSLIVMVWVTKLTKELSVLPHVVAMT